MTIELKDYQKEAVIKAVNIPYNMICCQTGRGKSVIGTFYARALFKTNKIDKVIYCSTKTGVNSFKKAFNTRLGVKVNQYDKEPDFMNFLISDEKVCIIKHSMLEKLGNDQNYLNTIETVLTHSYQRIAIVIDEAHKLSNESGVTHSAFMRLRFMFERISLHTATPYSSCLSQLYGLIHMIYPTLWKNKYEFMYDHIEERKIKDPRNGRVLRSEKVCYKNLDVLRKKIEPFSFFYYPPLDLHFKTYKTRLKNYEDYNKLCMGLISKEDLEEKKKNV